MRKGSFVQQCFKQANKCANDMGMTLTSRCKLVIPTKKEDPGADEFTALLQRRRASGTPECLRGKNSPLDYVL